MGAVPVVVGCLCGVQRFVAAFCDRLVPLNRALSCLASHGFRDGQGAAAFARDQPVAPTRSPRIRPLLFFVVRVYLAADCLVISLRADNDNP